MSFYTDHPEIKPIHVKQLQRFAEKEDTVRSDITDIIKSEIFSPNNSETHSKLQHNIETYLESQDIYSYRVYVTPVYEQNGINAEIWIQPSAVSIFQRWNIMLSDGKIVE